MERDMASAAGDLIFHTLGLVFFLMDLVLDILAVVTFYQEQAYLTMGVLILLLLGSSVLLHTFSWLWFNYDSEEENVESVLEKYFTNRRLLGVLHVCQVAIFFRFAAAMEHSVRSWRSGMKEKGIAVSLAKDLRLLRFIETFSENAPQLTLMLTVILHSKRVEWITGLKTLVSFVAIALSVLMYHYTMRAFNKWKAKMTLTSSLVYFLWNLLLIVSRVLAVALCASTLPVWGIAVHFIILWAILFLLAWLQKTDFMDNPNWEWLYRATVALIWYFSWFKVKRGDSTLIKRNIIIYHFIIAGDIMLLLGICWWHSAGNDLIFELPALWVFISVGSCYIVGIVVEMLYFKLFHQREPFIGQSGAPARACMGVDMLGSGEIRSVKLVIKLEPRKPLAGAMRRMQILSDGFYS